MSETHTVSREQVRTAYEALGLDPALLEDTAELTLTARTVTAVRFARDGEGRYYFDNGKIAEAITVLEIRGPLS